MFSKKQLFYNTASQILGRIATLAFALISIKILTNYLGVSGVGKYSTITTYINFFIVLADLGLFSITVREISKNPEKEKKILSNVFLIRFVSALLGSIVAIVIIFFTNYADDPALRYGVMIASGFLFFNLLSSVYDMILQTRLKMQYSALAEFLSRVITLAALIIIVRLNAGFLWVVFTSALSGGLFFLFKWLFASRFVSIPFSYDKKVADWIFNLAWPLGIVFIANNLYFKVDALLIYIFKGASDAGIYSVAYKVLEVTIFVGSYFASSLKPIFSQASQNDHELLKKIITRSLLIMVFLAAPITAVSLIYSKEIILFLSNSDFLSGSKALVLLSLTLPFIYLDMIMGEIMIAFDKRKTLVAIAFFILAFNLLLNLILIPRYSFTGAALVTLISEMALFSINFFFTRRTLRYRFQVKKIALIALITLLTIITGLFLRNLAVNFIFLMAISLIFYLALSHFFNIFKLNDLKSLIKED